MRSFRWRRFKQRKRERGREGRTSFPVRLLSSNAIPYAFVTLPRRPLSPISRSLFFFKFLRMLHLSQLSSSFFVLLLSPLSRSFLLRASPLCRYFPIDWSARRHPSRRSVRFSFISLFFPFEPFFIRRINPSFPLSPPTSTSLVLVFLYFSLTSSVLSLFDILKRTLYWLWACKIKIYTQCFFIF